MRESRAEGGAFPFRARVYLGVTPVRFPVCGLRFLQVGFEGVGTSPGSCLSSWCAALVALAAGAVLCAVRARVGCARARCRCPLARTRARPAPAQPRVAAAVAQHAAHAAVGVAVLHCVLQLASSGCVGCACVYCCRTRARACARFCSSHRVMLLLLLCSMLMLQSCCAALCATADLPLAVRMRRALGTAAYVLEIRVAPTYEPSSSTCASSELA